MGSRDTIADLKGVITASAPSTIAIAYLGTATNMVAQIAAGSAVDSAGPFTVASGPRTARIVLGAGGVPTVYTITGTDAENNGAARTETISAGAPGTFEGSVLWATVTRLESNIDPNGTTDLRNSSQGFVPATRSVYIGVTGDLTGQPLEGSADVTWANVPVGWCKLRLRHISLDTTADSIVAER